MPPDAVPRRTTPLQQRLRRSVDFAAAVADRGHDGTDGIDGIGGVDGIAAQVRRAIAHHRAVLGVRLVGSRAGGEPTPLSDWDFLLETEEPSHLADDLPFLAAALCPLAALWDPLSERAVYMLVLQGPVKIDLFPGRASRRVQPPWTPSPENLADVDAHFWNWMLRLGGKAFRDGTTGSRAELVELHHHLLGPLGSGPVADLDAAVSRYAALRAEREADWCVTVPRRLGEEVQAALVENGLIGSRRW